MYIRMYIRIYIYIYNIYIYIHVYIYIYIFIGAAVGLGRLLDDGAVEVPIIYTILYSSLLYYTIL